MNEALENAGEQIGLQPPQANEIHTYRYGEEILGEGDENDCFYVILGGHIRISRQGEKIRRITAQDIFGLEHILLKKPSPYTARAMDTARIATYGPEALDHFIRQNPRMTRMILVSALHQLMLTTRNFSQDTDSFPMDGVRVDFFTEGQILLEEGSTRKEFYRLISSQKGLLVTMHGKEEHNIRKPGEFFGEIAGLLGTPSPIQVTSIGESVVEIYTADDMDVIVRDYPEIALHMMNILISHHTAPNARIAGNHPQSTE